MMSKDSFRAAVKLELRKITSKLDRETRSMLASERFFSSGLYKDASCLFVFISKKTEIDTRFLIQRAFLDRKDVAVPRTNGETLDFYFLQPSLDITLQVEGGAFGILEPLPSLPKVDVDCLPVNSVFLLPGLAFAHTGARIGYGKGFYDRYITSVYNQNSALHLPRALVGFGFSCQVFDELPSDEHDIPLTHVISEKECIEVSAY